MRCHQLVKMRITVVHRPPAPNEANLQLFRLLKDFRSSEYTSLHHILNTILLKYQHYNVLRDQLESTKRLFRVLVLKLSFRSVQLRFSECEFRNRSADVRAAERREVAGGEVVEPVGGRGRGRRGRSLLRALRCSL